MAREGDTLTIEGDEFKVIRVGEGELHGTAITSDGGYGGTFAMPEKVWDAAARLKKAERWFWDPPAIDPQPFCAAHGRDPLEGDVWSALLRGSHQPVMFTEGKWRWLE